MGPHFFLTDTGTLAYPYPSRSTNVISALISKKLISWVRPGVELVFTRRLRLTSVLIKLDLPTLGLPKITAENVDRFATFAGVEHFQAALSKGKGILFMASHFGNWELMALAFSLKYHPAYLVVRPLDNPFLDRLISSIRCKGGNCLIGKRGSVRAVLRLLKQREIVALLIDQNVDWYEGVFVPFFKDIACTTKMLAVVALRTGAPVVPVYNIRLADGRYKVVFEPEVSLVMTGDKTKDAEENTALFNRIIEAYVRRQPEQWFWMHQRWKTRPYQPWPRET